MRALGDRRAWGPPFKPLTIPPGQTHACSLQGCWGSGPSTQVYNDHSLAPPREPDMYRKPVTERG